MSVDAAYMPSGASSAARLLEGCGASSYWYAPSPRRFSTSLNNGCRYEASNPDLVMPGSVRPAPDTRREQTDHETISSTAVHKPRSIP